MTVEELVLADVRSTSWLERDEERKAVKPMLIARDVDCLVTAQTAQTERVREMKA